jgi:hypothetical protein
VNRLCRVERMWPLSAAEPSPDAPCPALTRRGPWRGFGRRGLSCRPPALAHGRPRGRGDWQRSGTAICRRASARARLLARNMLPTEPPNRGHDWLGARGPLSRGGPVEFRRASPRKQAAARLRTQGGSAVAEERSPVGLRTGVLAARPRRPEIPEHRDGPPCWPRPETSSSRRSGLVGETAVSGGIS